MLRRLRHGPGTKLQAPPPHAPKLAPVIFRAITTEGVSLANPADLYILADFAANDPACPERLKAYMKNFLESDKGKQAMNIVEQEVGKQVSASSITTSQIE